MIFFWFAVAFCSLFVFTHTLSWISYSIYSDFLKFRSASICCYHWRFIVFWCVCVCTIDMSVSVKMDISSVLQYIVLYSNNTKRKKRKKNSTNTNEAKFILLRRKSELPTAAKIQSVIIVVFSFIRILFCFDFIANRLIFWQENIFFSAFFSPIKLFNFNQRKNVCRISSKIHFVSSHVRRFWLLACKIETPTKQHHFIPRNSIYHLWIDTNAIKMTEIIAIFSNSPHRNENTTDNFRKHRRPSYHGNRVYTNKLRVSFSRSFYARAIKSQLWPYDEIQNKYQQRCQTQWCIVLSGLVKKWWSLYDWVRNFCQFYQFLIRIWTHYHFVKLSTLHNQLIFSNFMQWWAAAIQMGCKNSDRNTSSQTTWRFLSNGFAMVMWQSNIQ